MFRKAGVAADRLLMEQPCQDYLSRYYDVDLLLDTYPYVGGGTTCDALCMGVPVVSLYGRRHGTRFGYSLQMNTGLEELTSALDIMPSLAKMVGFKPEPYWDGQLPAALGGRPREYVISNSLFPGQTYKLCIRTQNHEFRLETTEPTRADGTVDLSRFETHIYTRDEKHEEIEDPALQEFFMCRAIRHMKSFCHGVDEQMGK